jgi:hypothetical protein
MADYCKDGNKYFTGRYVNREFVTSLLACTINKYTASDRRAAMSTDGTSVPTFLGVPSKNQFLTNYCEWN